MAKVILQPGESIESLIKRFKTAVKKSDIMIELKKHRYFLKKSLKRKQKSKFARLKQRRKY